MPGENRIRKLLCVCIAAVIIISAAIIPAQAESVVYTTIEQLKSANSSGSYPADGMYNIINRATGLYLNVYDAKYDSLGRAYTSAAGGENGQDFLIRKQSNGAYLIYPQNDSGEYALRYKQSAGDGYVLEKSRTVDACSEFYILNQPDGAVTIIPANTSNGTLVLEGTQTKSLYGYRNASLYGYDRGENQLWDLIPAVPRSLELSASSMRVRLYSINDISAVVAPVYFSGSVTWTSSNESVALIGKDGSFCALGLGTTTVTACCGTLTAVCMVEVTDKAAYTWYSQHNIYTGGWNGGALSKLNFSSGGVTKRFAIDKYNRGLDWMDEGCALASVAMLLHNLDARLTVGCDFRSGRSGNLEADPYTVALANSYNNGSLTGSGVLYNNPIYVSASLIASRFNVKGKSIEATTLYSPSKQNIKELLDEHPEGVIVGFYNTYNEFHYILFTECINPDETNPNKYEFIVCDPAAYSPENGDHVRFEDSISYTNLYYRYSQIRSVQYWTVAK